MPRSLDWRTLMGAALSLIAANAFLPTPADAKATFVTFDVPVLGDTHPQAINKFNEVVGFFIPKGGHETGFLREPNGDVLFIDVPGSMSTNLHAINDRGEIVGTWQDKNGLGHCFVQKASGTIVSCDPVNGHDASGNSINNLGHVAGTCIDNDTGKFVAMEGPPRSISTFGVSDAVGTLGFALNDSDVVVGIWADTNAEHGYVRSPDGTIRFFDPPGSILGDSISADGAIAGSYADSVGAHSFVRDPGGTITTFDVPGVSLGSEATAINNKGIITGFGSDNTFDFGHGYVRRRDGTIKTFDAPRSFETFPAAINSSGVITGDFDPKNGKNRFSGFIRFPG